MARSVRLNGTSKADTLAGSGGDDLIDGRDGDDRLYGRNGSDTLLGGLGRDLLVGGGGHDSLHGEAGDDQLRGESGDDWLEGGAGNDQIDGGDGIDWLVFEHAASGARVDLSLQGAQDTGAGVDIITGVERVFGSFHADTLMAGAGTGPVLLRGWFGDDLLQGGEASDVLVGDHGDDSLTGLGSGDYMEGGLGNDTYAVESAADIVFERAGEGHDQVVASVSFVLPEHVEDLQFLGAFGGQGVGNGSNNGLRGSRGSDRLQGLGGDDDLFGDFGHDTLEGGLGSDRLNGGFGDDVLHGGSGADTLAGGGFTDLMAGGAGADAFVFESIRDSPPGRPDRITDFDATVDIIDLRAIDADVVSAGDQSFALVQAFTGAVGQAMLSYDALRDRTTLALDGDGDGTADFAVLINGCLPAEGGGFLLL